MMPLLSKKAINSVLALDFCRRLFFFFWVAGKSLNTTSSISISIPDRTGSTRCYLPWRCFPEAMNLRHTWKWIPQKFPSILLSACLWSYAAQMGSRSSAYPNHRGRWYAPCPCQMPNSSSINLSVSRWFCTIICCTFSVISGVLLVDGRPERGSSLVVSFPSRKRLNHSPIFP